MTANRPRTPKGWNSSLSTEERAERAARFEKWAATRGEDAIPPGGNFYDTGHWAWMRNKTLMKYGAKCMRCGTDGDSQNPIQVDHIKPRSKYRDLENDLQNLQVLCKCCNHEKSDIDETDWRRW